MAVKIMGLKNFLKLNENIIQKVKSQNSRSKGARLAQPYFWNKSRAGRAKLKSKS